MKHIGLFLASSIAGFDEENERILDFIRSINDRLVERGVIVDVFTSASDSLPVARDDGELIGRSRFFYALIGDRVEELTLAEFEQALDRFRSGGEPKIFTYFLEVPACDGLDSTVEEFKEKLDKELGHFYQTFSHPDTLKLNMMVELSNDPAVMEDVSFEDGKAHFGKTGLDMDLGDVPLYSKNADVAELRDECSSLEAELEAAKREVGDSGVGARMARIMPVRERLARARLSLHRLEGEILELYKRISLGEGPSTWRTVEASRRLERGDYAGAKALLDDEERESELRFFQEHADASVEGIRGYIAEERLKIELLESSEMDAEVVAQIAASYEKLAGLVRKHLVDIPVLIEYGWFLNGQGRHPQAIELAEQVLGLLRFRGEPDENLLYRTLDLLSSLYCSEKEFDKAMNYQELALDLASRLPGDDTRRTYRLAESLGTRGSLFDEVNRKADAEDCLRESLRLFRELYERDPDRYAAEFFWALFALAEFLETSSKVDEAREPYEECLTLARRRVDSGDGEWRLELASALQNLANHYKRMSPTESVGQLRQQAGPLYDEALKIVEGLYRANPERYLDDYADVLVDVALYRTIIGKFDEGESLFQRAIGIERDRAASDPGAALPDLAGALNRYACALNANRRGGEAAELWWEALTIYRALERKQPDAYGDEVADVSGSLGLSVFDEAGDLDQESLARESLSKFEALAEANPGRFLEELASAHESVAINLLDSGDDEEIRGHYKAYVDISRELFETNQSAYFEGNLADAYWSYGDYLDEEDEIDTAREAFQQAIRHYRSVIEAGMDERAGLAQALQSLGVLEWCEGNADAAVTLLAECYGIYDELSAEDPKKYLITKAQVASSYADALLDSGRREEAERLYRASIEASRLIDAKYGIDDEELAFNNLAALMMPLESLASLRDRRDRSNETLELLKEAFDIACFIARSCPEEDEIEDVMTIGEEYLRALRSCGRRADARAIKRNLKVFVKSLKAEER